MGFSSSGKQILFLFEKKKKSIFSLHLEPVRVSDWLCDLGEDCKHMSGNQLLNVLNSGKLAREKSVCVLLTLWVSMLFDYYPYLHDGKGPILL